MAPAAEMLFEALLSFLMVSVVSAQDQPAIKVEPGRDAPLQCRGPRGASVTLLEWSRPELKADGYVFFYRNERSYENYQLPSFVGRVELRDPGMKDGDASVVLRNVTANDTGAYDCRAIIVVGNETTPSEIRHLVRLAVADSGRTAGKLWTGGNKDGLRGVVVGSSVIGVLLVVVAVCISCFLRKGKGPKERNSYKAADNAGDLVT